MNATKLALFQLHLAVFLWGFTGIFGRLIHLPASELVWWRLAMSIIVLALYMRLSNKKFSFQYTPQILMNGALLGLHWVAFYASIQLANVSVGLVCLSVAGVFTAFIEPLFTKSTFQINQIALGSLAVIGVAFIFHFDVQYKLGIVIGLISTFLLSCFATWNKILLKHHKPNQLMFWELVGGFISVNIWMLTTQKWQISLPSTLDVFWLLILVVFCTIIAFEISLKSLKQLSAFTQNLILNLEPVYGIILAFLIYRENREIGWSFYAGLSLILSSVALQMWQVSAYRKSSLKTG